ncbi:programmed cell death protein 2 [Hypoxylon sp. FL1284]|nr:programmed cell death protein 2 [Hypoxylon sp. FL1284]
MAPYDSDSSGGEEDDFTETNVLLGYASKDPGDETISRLGGQPEWLDENSPPSASLARCKICKDLMVLLLQLNGELPDRFPGHERRLYVFSCRRKTCRRREGSIRALRSLRVAPGTTAREAAREKKKLEDEAVKSKLREEEKSTPKPPSNLGETLFGAMTLGSPSGSANPFSSPSAGSAATGSNPFSSGNPFSTAKANPETKTSSDPPPPSNADEVKTLSKTFAETLSLNNDQTPPSPATPAPPEPWPAAADQPPPYPVSYLSEAEYETLDPTPAPTVPASTRLDADADVGSGGGKEDREVFESSMDATFQRFADRLAQNPEQAIRYEFGGQPLLYSKTDGVGRLLSPASASPTNNGGISIASVVNASGTGASGMPRCGACGAPRAFEVQMAPHAIAELEADELSLDGMDWGTVVVGVCERDCQARGVGEGEVGYLEEWAGVQWEELGGGGKRRGG